MPEGRPRRDRGPWREAAPPGPGGWGPGAAAPWIAAGAARRRDEGRLETLTFTEDYHRELRPWLREELRCRSAAGPLWDGVLGRVEYLVDPEEVNGLQALLAGGGGPPLRDPRGPDPGRRGRHLLVFDADLLWASPPWVEEHLRARSVEFELDRGAGLVRAAFLELSEAENFASEVRHHFDRRFPPALAARPRRPSGEHEIVEAAALEELGSRLPDVEEEERDRNYYRRRSCRVFPT